MSKYKSIFISNSNQCDEIFTKLINSNDIHNSKRYLYELISITISKEISYDKCIDILNKIISIQNQSNFIKKYIIEILWLTGFDLDNEKNKSKDSKVFTQILNYFLSKNLCDKNRILESFEENTLTQSEIIPDQAIFKNKITKINTKMNYEQQKYNLLREESEGFSKLINLVFELGSIKNLNENSIQIIIDRIICLMGFFDLEPTRVLDITLEAFKYNPFNTVFIKIFEILNKKAFPHVIGLKLNDNKSINLFIVIAQLLKYEIITLEQILVHLTPSLNDMENEYNERIKHTINISKHSLNEKIINDLRAQNNFSLEEGNISNKTAGKFCNFEEIANEAINYNKLYFKNQIYLLLEGMIRIKDRKNSEILYSLIKNFYDPLENRNLSKVLCELIEWIIEPINNKNTNNNLVQIDKDINSNDNFYQSKTIDELFDNFSTIFKLLNLGLSSNQILFQKILKTIRLNINQITSNNILKEKLIYFITNTFFPSLSLIDPTPILVNELWQLLNQFDYNIRYSLYNKWLNNVYTMHPYLYIKYDVITKEIGKWHNSLTKENQRQHGRILGIISNGNPLIVFDNIIRLLTSYENQINIFIGALSFCSNLSYDVITFVICKILCDKRYPKIDINSCQIMNSFKNFAYFIGCFYKKYYTVEIKGVLIYIINKFKNDEIGIEIFVLKELIERMSGIKTQEILNEDNYLSECGGIHLYLEELNLGKEYKYYKKPSQVLLKFFQEYDLFSTLFFLFNIKKQNIIYSSNLNSEKLISFLYDQFQLIYLQYLTFLNFYGEKENVSKNFLNGINIDDLVKKYNLRPIDIYSLLRKNLNPIFNQTKDEYLKNINLFISIFDINVEEKRNLLSKEFDSNFIDTKLFIESIYKPIWDFIPKELFYIFNSLELKDLFFPINQYEKSIDKLKREKENLNPQFSIDGNNTENNVIKNKKEIEKIIYTIDNLNKEIKSLKNHHENVLNFLKVKLTSIFNSIPQNNKKDLPIYLLQYLLYPRLIQSKNDAIFSVKFLSLLLSLKIPMINILDIIMKITKFLLPSTLCVTEYEGGNIGIFLNDFLKTIKSYLEPKFWEENCKNNPSFSRSLEKNEIVSYDDFKKAFDTILSQMSKAFRDIFIVNEDYMNIRNAVNILRVITLIPHKKENANELIKSISNCYDKFKGKYDDSIIIKRYKDTLVALFMNPGNISGMSNINLNNGKREKSETKKEIKRKKDRSRDNNSKRNNDKKKSPDNYKKYRN